MSIAESELEIHNPPQQTVYFVHMKGQKARAVQALATDSVAAIVQKAGFEVTPEMGIFLGECIDALAHEASEQEEDHHQPVGHGHRPGEHGHHGGHIHCHHCHRVLVGVTFNGTEKHRKFSPATTIDTVRLWAINRFGITPADADRLILVVNGASTDDPPPTTEHLGDLVTGHTCDLSFQLIPDPRING